MADMSIRDPSTVNCRIYVGNLKENTQKNDLQNIFSKYGNIVGVMVSRNFGFIQFENEQSANNAIDNENQKMYNGRKIAVSKAQNKGNPKQQHKPGNNMGGFGSGGGGGGGGGGGNQNEMPMQNTQSSSISNTSGSDSNMNQSINNSASNNSSNNFGSNNNSNNVGGPQRQNWMRNRNNNRNNNNDMSNSNPDRERSPFGRDSNNDRWNNQDGGGGGGGGNFNNNFRNNNRNSNNNMNRNNNNNNNSNMNSMGGNSNFGNSNNSMGNMGSNKSNNMNMSNSGPQQSPFGMKPDVKNVLNGGVLQGYASAREIRAKYPNANDCEIVVLEKQLLDYAEFIENRLKRGGLTADLLFPNADLSIGKMLSNIVNRGSLYALIISSEHKQHNSVTLNILYGVPSEHRNMPLEDAFTMIFRNYQHLRQGENGDIIGDTDDSPYAAIPMANTRHPDSLQHLINLLADNRTLTVLQFDCILTYLKERRENQYKFELGDTGIDISNQSNSDDSKSANMDDGKNDEADAAAAAEAEAQAKKANEEEEIQKKLMAILSKPTIPNIKPDTSTVTKASPEKKLLPSTSNTDTNVKPSNQRHQPNLLTQDPKLRNVLDSLMFEDI